MGSSSVHPYGNNPVLSSSSDVVYAYDGGQDVGGVVHLTLPHGKSYEHLGVKIQFLGRISMAEATVFEGRPKYDFISLLKELQPPTTLYQTSTTIPFHFHNIEKQYETYHGRNVSISYTIRVLVERKFLPPLKKDAEVIFQIRNSMCPVNQNDIKMEVGIEECLHIEFQFEKKMYHLRDCIIGKVNFVTVRIKIKYMELAVIRRESCGEGVGNTANSAASGMPSIPGETGGQVLTETQTLIRHEIMDGAPVKGEVIPVRLFLSGIPADLTPTVMAPRFSIRYYLNLVLVDEVDRRYFKQQEIILWRKDLG